MSQYDRCKPDPRGRGGGFKRAFGRAKYIQLRKAEGKLTQTSGRHPCTRLRYETDSSTGPVAPRLTGIRHSDASRETEFAGAQLSRGTVGIRDSFALLPSLIARNPCLFFNPPMGPCGIGDSFPGPRRDSRSPEPPRLTPPTLRA